eukprot:31102-Pelagococcus_subviridis.AAC.4
MPAHRGAPGDERSELVLELSQPSEELQVASDGGVVAEERAAVKLRECHSYHIGQLKGDAIKC